MVICIDSQEQLAFFIKKTDALVIVIAYNTVASIGLPIIKEMSKKQNNILIIDCQNSLPYALCALEMGFSIILAMPNAEIIKIMQREAQARGLFCFISVDKVIEYFKNNG